MEDRQSPGRTDAVVSQAHRWFRWQHGERLHSAHLYRKVGATQATANAAGVQRMSRRQGAVANDTDGKNLRRKRRPPRCVRKRRGQRWPLRKREQGQRQLRPPKGGSYTRQSKAVTRRIEVVLTRMLGFDRTKLLGRIGHPAGTERSKMAAIWRMATLCFRLGIDSAE
jgi:hypothetical protein